MMYGFTHRLQQVIARSKRRPKFDSALILVDLKAKTKPQKVIESFAPVTRVEDTVGILTEQQIAVVVEDLTHISDPLRIARRLRAMSPEVIQAISIVCDLGSFERADFVLEKALENLEQAQKQEECVYSQPELGAEAAARLDLESDLDDALENGGLVTYFQPIFNLTRGTLTGFEALVRWEHPERGLLLPGAFLDVAEQRGHLLKIDEFVLQDTLRQIPIWNEKAEHPIYVCVNLASAHFLKAENLNTLVETLKTHPRSLDLLRVDVSEQVLLEDNGIESLKALDNLRIGFNLDDFGVDSSSFHCLGSFAFNSLKIDRSLIDQMEDEVNAELIVAVLRIAKRMGMKTIAEGVVTHAQLEELRNLGCTEAQGFLFSEAVNIKEASQLITTEYRW